MCIRDRLSTELEPNLGLTGTGQDVSIMRSTLIQTGVIRNAAEAPVIEVKPGEKNMQYMLQTIQKFFAEAGINGEQNFGELYNRLSKPEYGIGLKKGVIPIYIAIIIHLNRGNLVIKKANVEQKISADLLNDINDKPNNYSVVLENWNEEKALYLARLEELLSLIHI